MKTNFERFARKHPDILFINSEARGVHYATAMEDHRVGIICERGRIVLTEKQAHAVAKELREVFALYAGRGQ